MLHNFLLSLLSVLVSSRAPHRAQRLENQVCHAPTLLPPSVPPLFRFDSARGRRGRRSHNVPQLTRAQAPLTTNSVVRASYLEASWSKSAKHPLCFIGYHCFKSFNAVSKDLIDMKPQSCQEGHRREELSRPAGETFTTRQRQKREDHILAHN